MQAGLAKLIGLAGETNVQASAPAHLDRLDHRQFTSEPLACAGGGAEEAGHPVQRGVRQGSRQQRSHRMSSSCPLAIVSFSSEYLFCDLAPLYAVRPCVRGGRGSYVRGPCATWKVSKLEPLIHSAYFPK